MTRIRKYLLCGLAFFTLIHSPEGVCTTERDFQSWLNLTVTGNFSKENTSWHAFKYWLEGQERIGDDSSRFSQTLLRTGLGYSITRNTSIWLGYAWIHTGIPFTRVPFKENRIWQQLLWIKSNPHFTFSSRTRTEQQFFLEHRLKVAYRIRQLVKIMVPFQYYPHFSFVSHDEVFWHTNNFIGKNGRGFDQNRFFIGIGYKTHANAVFSTEMGYMNQYIRRFEVPNFLSNILSINFFLNFD
ncbi:DUF2490 domain-containing protein [Legionella fairfieldensis]|uniref:DUF2490 domain-containing protein n=1 Tax=Legionella fairfieldensis TaxID=45064 RepID=UPI000A400FA8|nr:DUF2490 domain-containing protein [Legionella fairfieldensis]